MPHYEFRCRECAETFVLDRPMSASGDPAHCALGHADTVRLLSTVALAGVARGSGPAPRSAGSGGGGCCGGGCCG